MASETETYISFWLNEDGDLQIYPASADPGEPCFTLDKREFVSLARELIALADGDSLGDEFDLQGSFGFVTDPYQAGGGVKGCEACGGTGKVSDGE